MLTISPFLWFDTQAEEAMNFYASVFPRSKVLSVSRAQGRVMSVEFELEGNKFMALNAGPLYKFNGGDASDEQARREPVAAGVRREVMTGSFHAPDSRAGASGCYAEP